MDAVDVNTASGRTGQYCFRVARSVATDNVEAMTSGDFAIQRTTSLDIIIITTIIIIIKYLYSLV